MSAVAEEFVAELGVDIVSAAFLSLPPIASLLLVKSLSLSEVAAFYCQDHLIFVS